ncbi:three-Cys-motif partner protein TcmP [Kribbella sp. CA-294648]|uniref:three-Cys-motif partner protein TcmP n=1 Tax=Kribbella sp. CA-294648 TaxID=3239948 RepID=UPI003D8F970E
MADSDPKKWEYPDHTQAKHDIFSKYLDAWFPILSSTHGRILILDGYAGRGVYNDGQPGSPIIALDRLLKHSYWPQMQHREFIFIFIEHDPSNVASLTKALADYRAEYESDGKKWPDNVKYEVRTGSFADHATEMCDYLDQQGSHLAPTFAFIDPFGWTGMPMQLVARLLNHPSCEVFINFMVGFVNRFIAHPDQTENMNELFGLDVEEILANFTGGDRVEYLRDVYMQQLRDVAGFPHVRWFAMRNHTGNVGYYLLHGTRDARGVEKMKDAMWKTAPGGDYSFSDRLAGLDVLFQPEADVAPLRKALLQKYAGQKGVMVNPDVQQWVILDTPYRKPHLTTVLRELENESVIKVNRPPNKRQFTAGVTIDVPKV